MWTDSYVCPPTRADLANLLRIQRAMGFTSVGLCSETWEREPGAAELGASLGIKLYRVAVLEASGVGEAKKKLSELRGADVVLGRPRSAEAYRFMSRDSRFNIVEVPPKMMKIIDRGEASLLTIGGGSLGFSLRVLVNRPKNAPIFKDFMQRVLHWSIPFKLYSSATCAFEAWHPRHVYFLANALGLPGKRALEGFSGGGA